MPTLTYAEQLVANVSEACHADGVGCDGENENPLSEAGICDCLCHSPHAPNFRTNDEVREFHAPFGY